MNISPFMKNKDRWNRSSSIDGNQNEMLNC